MSLDIQGTDYLKLPVGTTAQRPSVPASGMIRQNSTTGEPEWYDSVNSVWLPFRTGPSYTVNFLIVGGGASGGSYYGGGGGGGANGATSPWVSGAGGSGVVIIAYLSATQKGTGGTVTSSGGYYIHTFTSSGAYVG